MGCRNREIISEEDCTRPSSSSSSSDALLFATMCLIGMPVDVHVKDGSVYSGIFHTASGEKDYGIVLKKARMTKKGKSNANVAKVGVIETLVILSCDLVQVVAKGVLFPADAAMANMVGDDMEAIDTSVPYLENAISEPEKSTPEFMESMLVTCERSSHPAGNVVPTVSSFVNIDNKHKRRLPKTLQMGKHKEVENGKMNERNSVNIKIDEVFKPPITERQAGDDKLITQNDEYKYKFESNELNNASKVREDDATCAVTASIPREHTENGHPDTISKFTANGASIDNLPAPAKPNVQSLGRFTLGPTSTENITFNVSSPNQGASGGPDSSHELPAKSDSGNSKSSMRGKEFKLNPGAKIFSPSLANPISATHNLPAVPNMAYAPNSSHVMTVPPVQPDTSFSPYRPPVKFPQYGSMTAGSGGSASQFSNHVLVHMGHRAPAVRFSGNYIPALADPAYLPPTSPAVMVGRRLGQLVYVHPLAPDLVQGAPTFAPAPARPHLTPSHVQIPKQYGLAGHPMQYCVPPPPITNGLQPFPLPSHAPVLRPPFAPGRPIPVPGSNAFYGTKL